MGDHRLFHCDLGWLCLLSLSCTALHKSPIDQRNVQEPQMDFRLWGEVRVSADKQTPKPVHGR